MRKASSHIAEQLDPEMDEPEVSSSKEKVECICPGCRKRHLMSFRWIGRGTPRKFCPSCKERGTPLPEDDLY